MKAKAIGLTGGIASGKSTVSQYLKDRGYQVLDADQLVHELQQKEGRLYQALLAYFGPVILDEAGNLDRPQLSQLIFSSPETLRKSSELQDHIIRQELRQRYEDLKRKQSVFFMDIPLLYERQYEDWFDKVWLVYVNSDQQLSRLMARNKLSKEEALDRIQAQMSLDEKRVLADAVVDNSGSLTETYSQLDKLLEDLEKDSL
ncbi:dephospho-CoA kinase [Streptococcus ferus]|uniref:dephospho-CoA kinase n=1 Tax=Streptococcus ferus TaxID=1345 RepID=UPI0023563FB4|nr:dephospho-CoA kinase [Streptococcus ferus]